MHLSGIIYIYITRGMKQIYPNLSLIGVNSMLNLSFDVRLNV